MKTKIAAVLVTGLMAVLGVSASASAAVPEFPPGVTTPDDCTGKQIYYFFEYNDSASVGFDSGCAEKNDVVGQIAPKLHVSCSDKFEGGVSQKGDLGDPDRRVVAYYIDKDGKICGFGTPTPISAGGIVGGALASAGLAGAAVMVQRRRRTASLTV